MRLGIVYISAGKRQRVPRPSRASRRSSVPAQIAQLWMLAATSPPRKPDRGSFPSKLGRFQASGVLRFRTAGASAPEIGSQAAVTWVTQG